MTTSTRLKLPRSLRKHLRRRKAALRRELAPARAEQAIANMLRRLRA